MLGELQSSLASALSICEVPGRADEILAEVAAAEAARPLALANSGGALFSSNGGESPRLFYAPTPSSGIGLQHRGQPFAGAPRPGLSPEDDASLRHYGVQQLSDYARASMLGEMADYLPSHRDESTSRQRFNALLARVQQHQLARTVQNECGCAQANLPTLTLLPSLPPTVHPPRGQM